MLVLLQAQLFFVNASKNNPIRGNDDNVSYSHREIMPSSGKPPLGNSQEGDRESDKIRSAIKSEGRRTAKDLNNNPYPNTALIDRDAYPLKYHNNTFPVCGCNRDYYLSKLPS